MPLFTVKIRKTIVHDDEVVIRALDKDEAKFLVENLCFRDEFAGTLLGKSPRKLFNSHRGKQDKQEKLEVVGVTVCLVKDDLSPTVKTITETNAHISVE